jgi:CBS domain-containing membrane protein
VDQPILGKKRPATILRIDLRQFAGCISSPELPHNPEDVDAALADMDQTFDIDRGDLDALLRQVELKALIRAQKNLPCADIMSRDVVSIGPSDSTDHARAVLLEHNIRTLPVTDVQGALLGIVGLRELARPASQVLDVLSSPAIAHAEAPAFSLLPTLTDGRTHAVVVVDAQSTVIGLITQTDLLAAAARSIAND